MTWGRAHEGRGARARLPVSRLRRLPKAVAGGATLAGKTAVAVKGGEAEFHADTNMSINAGADLHIDCRAFATATGKIKAPGVVAKSAHVAMYSKKAGVIAKGDYVFIGCLSGTSGDNPGAKTMKGVKIDSSGGSWKGSKIKLG